MKIQKRMKFVIMLIMVILLGLIGRLAQIQLYETESFSKHHINLIEDSVKQRTQSIILDAGRGRFIDRNGEAITNEYYPGLVLFPFLKNTQWPSKEVAQILGIPEVALLEAVQQAEEPFAFRGKNPVKLTEKQQEQLNALKTPGVFALYQQVENQQNIGEHLIGLVRQNQEILEKRYRDKLEKGLLTNKTQIGITGLQRAFDEFLLPEGESRLLYHVDKLGDPLFGLDVKYTAPANPYYPTAIKTTLNRSMQLLAEEIIDDSKSKKGGMVLLDVRTSDVLAMVSRPKMRLDNPLGDAGGINHMIQPQTPGSVFKIVTGLAAIDTDVRIRGRAFNCDLNLYGDTIGQRKLGPLNFDQSFAKSCNYTFAKLAEEMIENDPNVIDHYAQMLGLTDTIGWHGDVFHFHDFRQFPEEKTGIIWGNEQDKQIKKAINQTAIGQKEVKISPLAIANMMATIARGGERKQVRAVTEVQYKNGATLFSFSNQLMEGEQLSRHSISIMQKLLEGVIQDGTGQRFKSLPYQVAGKSGTAQTGRNGTVNKWFAGYFPVEDPKYALVVVELDVKEEYSKTNDIFEQIVLSLFNIHEDDND